MLGCGWRRPKVTPTGGTTRADRLDEPQSGAAKGDRFIVVKIAPRPITVNAD